MSCQTVCSGAQIQCSFGMAPSILNVLPGHRTLSGNSPRASIIDHKPLVNILPFGMCSSIANPLVASATAAAFGVMMPMPCIPNTVAPWIPGLPTVLIDNMPALDMQSILMCTWGGVIRIHFSGQVTTQIT